MSGALKAFANLEINKFLGLYTKSNPDVLDVRQLAGFQNFSTSTEYGSAAKVKGMARVLAGALANSIDSIMFYKASSLHGTILRHVLISADDDIYLVNTVTGAVSASLKTGRTAGLHNKMTMIDRFGIITNHDPHLIGNGDEPVKYDGDSITKLGIDAPGSTVLSTILSYDSAATVTSTSNCSVATETTITWDGASTKITASAAAGPAAEAQIYTGFAAKSINADQPNRVAVYLYIPRGELQKLVLNAADQYCVAVAFWSSIAPVRNRQYWWQPGQLNEGWNKLIMDLSEAPVAPFGASNEPFNPAAVVRMYVNISCTLASQPVVYVDFAHDYVNGAPDIADGTGYDVKDQFGDAGGAATNWYVTDGTIAFTAADPPDATEGANFVRLNKLYSAGNVYMYIETNTATSSHANFDVTDDINGAPSIDIYIPTPLDLEAVGAVRVRLGAAGLCSVGASIAYDEWVFDREDLAAGWNRLYLPLDSPTNQNYGGLQDPTTVPAFGVVFTFIDDAARASEYVGLDNLRSVDVGGTLTGNYSYKVTYQTRYGVESNAGPASETITFSSEGGAVDLTNIPVSTDTEQVIARHLYRTAGGGTEWLYLTTIYDNETTIFTDNISDGGLSATRTPPELGDGSNDHSPPPNDISFTAVWKKTVFAAGSPTSPDYLFYSNDDAPEEWPIINAFKLDSRITGMTKTYQGLTLTTNDGFWRVTGDNPNFFVEHIIDGMGGVGPRGVGTARNYTYALDRDGLRLFDLRDTLKISEPIRDKYEALAKDYIYDCFVAHSTKENAILQFNRDASGDPVRPVFMYNYMQDDVKEGVWSLLTGWANTVDITDAREVETDDEEKRLYVAASDGMLYEFFNDDSKNWVNEDGTAKAITSFIQTNWLRLANLVGGGEDPVIQGARVASGRTRVVWVELRISGPAVSTGSTWTFTVESAMGADEGSATLSTGAHKQDKTITFPIGESMVRIAVQDFSPWDWVRFTVSNAELDKAVTLRAIRVGFDTHPMAIVWPK